MAHFVVSALQHVQFWMDSFHIWRKWLLTWEDVLHAMTFDLDLYLDFAIKRLKYGILSCLLYSMYSSGWIIFSCDQAALWMVQSVCLSVCPSIRHTFFTMFPSSYHMKFSGVITSDRSDVHAKGLDQRSKVKVTEVTAQVNPFQIVTPVWIHIWWWNDAYSLIMLRERCPIVFQGHPSNFKVTRF